jgi:fumarate hydratase subunit beta
LAAVGGLGALLARRITAASVVAYDDLGPEALFAFDIDAFPAVVIIDREGRNYHETARAAWRRV